MARAMSSLPVPLSPVMSTDALVGATFSMLVEDPLHDGAAADHLVALELLLGDSGQLSARLRGVEHVAHADEHALAREGLLEEVARAELDGLHRVVDGRVPADDDDGQVSRRLVAADLRERFEPAHVGQLHVEDREVDRRLRAREDGQRLRRRSPRRETGIPRPRARAGACAGCSSRRRRRAPFAEPGYRGAGSTGSAQKRSTGLLDPPSALAQAPCSLRCCR